MRHGSKSIAVLVLFGICLAFDGCSVGSEHTSDARLERNFVAHQVEFEALLADLQRDEQLEMINTINTHAFRYAGQMTSATEGLDQIEPAGMTVQRVEEYQRRLRDLGLTQVAKSDRGIEFRVDPGSLFNGNSYKGYEYSLDPLKHPKPSLDSYRISDIDRDGSGGYYVSKPLKGHWRLYLSVSG